MRVALISPPDGLAEALAARGHDVRSIAGAPPAAHALFRRRAYEPGLADAPLVAWRLSADSFDVAHAFSPAHAWAAVALTRVPCVVSLAETPSRRWLVAQRYRLPMLLRAAAGAAAVTVPSEAGVDPCRRYLLREPVVAADGESLDRLYAQAPMVARTPKTLLPPAARQWLRELFGLEALYRRISVLEQRLDERLDRLETQLHESHDDVRDRSRARWREARPDIHLTWGGELPGEPFVEKAEAHGAFGASKTVLEVGPGYGRLLATCVERGVEFGSYIGIDLSPDNIAHLESRFPQPNVRFVEGDVEQVALDEDVDSLIASLTFKHLFPSFEQALRNLRPRMRPGAVAVFDLIEGERRFFEPDGVTYIRWYTRAEVEAILARVSLELVAFDEVRHLPEQPRLLVVARAPE